MSVRVYPMPTRIKHASIRTFNLRADQEELAILGPLLRQGGASLDSRVELATRHPIRKKRFQACDGLTGHRSPRRLGVGYPGHRGGRDTPDLVQ